MKSKGPGPGNYNYKPAFGNEGPCPSMHGAPTNPLSRSCRNFETTPGPGMYNSTMYNRPNCPGFKMGKSSRDMPNNAIKRATPGPGEYSFDKSLNKDIYNVILKQNYSITVQDEGDKLRIIFPQLTTDKRKEAIKNLSSYKEQGKIKIRNNRQNILKKIKNDKELTEDMEKQYQNEIQKIVDQYNNKIDLSIKNKEDQLMKM